MKIVFMGTPEFALQALKALSEKHEIVCVYCQPPKEAGRGYKLLKSPVQEFAESKGIEVRTPKSFKTEGEKEKFQALQADVTVVAAYGLILPSAVFDSFKYKCVNIHGSLLPRWRGAAPIHRAIEAGDKKTGITIMQVIAGLDAGMMYLKGEIEIMPDTTGGVLHDEMAKLGAELILEYLDNIETIKGEPQDESLVTYANKIDKLEAKIDFNQTAEILERKIRAFNPYPSCYFEYNGERFKVLKAIVDDRFLEIGEICQDGNKLFLGCAKGALEVVEIQRQGKKVCSVAELLNGFSFKNCVI